VSHDEEHPLLDPAARGLVRRKARQLVGKAGLTHRDRRDVEQELSLRLLYALEAFDPRRGPPGPFAARVLDRLGAKLLRERRATKRGLGRVASWIGALDVADPAGEARCERVGMAADVEAVLASLPPDLRDLARRLGCEPLAAVARELGVPRTTLQGHVRRIRQRFEDAGLRGYL
jgi:RNA polymerase sigma-70 factor (ECF subfamily)